MKKILIVLSLLISCLLTKANNWHFAAAGDDATGDGSTLTPWKTTTKFNSIFSSKAAGDTFSFNRGDVFQGWLTISRSGASGSSIVITAYGTGANPIITGMLDITAWTSLGSNLWQSTSAVSTMNDCNMVTINDVMIPMGRTPNTFWFPINSHTPTLPSQTPPWTLSSTSIDSTVTDWTGADVVFKPWNFSIVRNPIYRDSANKLFFTPNTTENWAQNTGGFFIENDVRTLDQQNEWYFNPSNDKLTMYSTTTPSGVKIARYDSLVYINAKNFIKFDGLDFVGSNRRTFNIISSDSILITNCRLDLNGLYAIWGGTNGGNSSLDFNINHSRITRVGSQGITLANEFSNVYIGYDSIINTGWSYGMFKVPIFDNGQNSHWNGAFGSIILNNIVGSTIEYNYIDSSGYAGLWLNGGTSRIHHNDITHCVMKLMDNAAIYSQGIRGGTNWTDIRIHHNLCHDNLGDSSGVPVQTGKKLASGIYLDENTWDTQVDSNSCWNNALYGIFSNSNTQCRFRYNRCFNNGSGSAYFSSKFRGIRNMPSPYIEREISDTVENNIFVAQTGTTFNEQYAVRFGSKYSTIDSFFTKIDNNIYTRPIDENTTNSGPIENDFSSTGLFSHYTLSQWKTYANGFTNCVGKDQSATRSPVTPIISTSDLIIQANPLSTSQTYSLPYLYQDMYGNEYNGSITLQPYMSEILVKAGALRPAGNTTIYKLYRNYKFKNF